MKIRTGFVSNSSSSSFLMYGICIKDRGAYTEFLETKVDSYSKENNHYPELSYWIPDGFDQIFIGAEWNQIKDDETGKQFKQRVENQINKLIQELNATFDEVESSDGVEGEEELSENNDLKIKDISFETYKEAWYD